MEIIQYALLISLFGSIGIKSFQPTWITDKHTFESRLYTNGETPRFIDAITSKQDQVKYYLLVRNSYTLLKRVVFNVGMQGWTNQNSWNGGCGGGVFGGELILNQYLRIKIEHFSGHTFNLPNNAGSYDYFGIIVEL